MDNSERPRCGRLTASGGACAQMLTFSAPLSRHSVACRRHMTVQEREDFDAEPLWTIDAQILWALRQGSDEGQTAKEIGDRIRQQSAAVKHALRRLAAEARVTSWAQDRKERWGTREQRAASRRRVDEAARRQEEQARLLRCRDQRLAELKAQLKAELVDQPGIGVLSLRDIFPGTQRDEIMITTSDPDAAEWLLDRLQPDPSENLDRLLATLLDAGWVVGDVFRDLDDESGLILYGEMNRTGMAINFEYEPDARELRLVPFEDVAGDGLISYLAENVVITLADRVDDSVERVEDAAGRIGLLDATRLRAAPGDEVDIRQIVANRYFEYVFEPAAEQGEDDVATVVNRIFDDRYLKTHLSWLFVVAHDVLPDLVPSAVAIGVVAWCWRNNTAVEAWHLSSDVLMARANIAATKAVMDHVDPDEGVDWSGVERALTDGTLSLPSGQAVADLFGEGWADVRQTVIEQLHNWRRVEDELLGPTAAMRLLTVGGSTSYTRHWWGQGRWPAICADIVRDAATAGLALPAPYDRRGPDALLHDLRDPDTVSDDVLDWLIDIPEAGRDGPRGLRMHEATEPPTVPVSSWDVPEEDADTA